MSLGYRILRNTTFFNLTFLVLLPAKPENFKKISFFLISIFYQNFYLLRKFRFFLQNFDFFTKVYICYENCYFLQNLNFLRTFIFVTKIYMFHDNFYFLRKFQFFQKVLFLRSFLLSLRKFLFFYENLNFLTKNVD